MVGRRHESIATRVRREENLILLEPSVPEISFEVYLENYRESCSDAMSQHKAKAL